MPQAAARHRKKDAPSRARRQGKGEMLSPSTRRARWVESKDDHEERKGQTLATRSHEVIMQWAEERDAVPATVPTKRGDAPRVLRFIFPQGEPNGRLESVAWEDWFRTFDDRKLVMLFQEHRRDGRDSNFFRFDSPDREDG